MLFDDDFDAQMALIDDDDDLQFVKLPRWKRVLVVLGALATIGLVYGGLVLALYATNH